MYVTSDTLNHSQNQDPVQITTIKIATTKIAAITKDLSSSPPELLAGHPHTTNPFTRCYTLLMLANKASQDCTEHRTSSVTYQLPLSCTYILQATPYNFKHTILSAVQQQVLSVPTVSSQAVEFPSGRSWQLQRRS